MKAMSNVIADIGRSMYYVQFARIEGRVMRGHLETLRENLNIIARSASLRGGAKDAIANVIDNQHIPIAMAIENAYWKIGVKVQEMVDAFLEYMEEPDEKSAFEMNGLTSLRDEMIRINHDKQGLDGEAQISYNRINDILPLSMPTVQTYEQSFGLVMETVDLTICRLGEFTFDFSDIEELIEEIRSYVNELQSRLSVSIDSPGRQSIMNGSNFPSRMRAMHGEFAQAELDEMEELYRQWGTQDHRRVNFYPQTSIEREVWERFWEASIWNFDNFRKVPVTEAHGGVYTLWCRTTGRYSPEATTAYRQHQHARRAQGSLPPISIHIPSPMLPYHRERLNTGINSETGEPLTFWERFHSRAYIFFDGFRAATPLLRAGMAGYTYSNWHKVGGNRSSTTTTPSNTRTLPNGRTLNTTNNFTGYRGNFLNSNAPHMVWVNGKWVRINTHSPTGRDWNNFFGARYGSANVNWWQPLPVNTRILPNGRILQTTNNFTGYHGNIQNINAPIMVRGADGKWVRINAENLTFTNSARHQNRLYQESTQLIREIINSGPPSADPRNSAGFWWKVDGVFNGRRGTFEILISPDGTTIWHFLFKRK